MTTLKIWTGVCATLLLVAMVVSGTAVAQDPKAQDPKVQDAKVAEGTLLDIDQNAKMLTLKSGNDEVKFSFTDQTQLVAPDNGGKPPVVSQGTKMRVTYTENEKAKIATKIEIIESTASH